MFESSTMAHRPFASAPAAAAYVRTATHQAALENLVRCVERAEGVGLIVGPAGSGKSLLLNLLAAGFRGKFHVAMLNSSQLCTRKALLQSILFELRLPYREMDEGELRLSLLQHLMPREGEDDSLGLLLLIDEAHSLPLRLLEEIRQLTNLMHGGQPRVRLVLAGNASMEERLGSPKLTSFQQRLATRCYLHPLKREETLHYVREQVRQNPRIECRFGDDALEAIFTATDGIPRLINQLCDHALVLAALGGHSHLDAHGIEEAWSDLQQLPLPWSEKAAPAVDSGASIIEFGELDDGQSTLEPGLQVTVGLSDRLSVDPVESASLLMDRIDDEIASLDLPDGELSRSNVDRRYFGEFSPLRASNTEVEVIFESGVDPFGQGFEEEEVIIDRYATLEASVAKSRPQVHSEEGRQITAALFAAKAAAAVTPAQIARTEATELVEPLIVGSRPIDEDLFNAAEPEHQPVVIKPSEAANDPVYPEHELAASAHRATLPLRDFGADDRDIIIVEEEGPRRKSHTAPGKPRRPEYRKLFSTLRKG
jgi:type II secretory pathway predicted ATPase ExeA